MTPVTTLASMMLTPLLTPRHAGRIVDVPASEMLLDVLTRLRLGRRPDVIIEVSPLISVLAVALIIGMIVALNQARLGEVATVVVLAVVLFTLPGLASGWGLARWAGLDASCSRRTPAIEVGMQSSGPADALAVKYFQPVAALPGARFSVWQSISGSALATYWSRWRS